MCGRFTLASELEQLSEHFGDLQLELEFSPRYNITPTQDVAVIANTSEVGGGHKVEFYHWGLIPSWAKDPKIGSRMINARSETLTDKPSFRSAYKRRRCLILADGYYEWQTVPGEKSKQPIYIRLKSQNPFAFAGLWEEWKANYMEKALRSCTIITCSSNSYLEEFHHRMPVILPKDAYAQWLSPDEQSNEMLQPLLQPYPDDKMEAYPVSRFVNRPANDSPECIQRVSATDTDNQKIEQSLF